MKKETLSVSDTLFLVSSTAYNLIKEQLIELGFNKESIYYFQPAGLSLGNEDYRFIKKHIYEFQKTYDWLCDLKSKKFFWTY